MQNHNKPRTDTPKPQSAKGGGARTRVQAARYLQEVLNGAAFEASRIDEQPDRALLLELCFGTLRFWPRLNQIASHFLKKPFANKDFDVHALLCVGIYQLLYTRIPDHAAISETVEACARIGKPWGKGLLNGVLRNVQRQRDRFDQLFGSNPEYLNAHPEWLCKKIQLAWGDAAEGIFLAGNGRPPMDLRVNLSKISLPDYCAKLTAEEIPFETLENQPAALSLSSALAVSALPGFDQGLVSVQDRSAQLTCSLLEIEPGMRILDACSAPGGKAAHILESEPAAQLCALDLSESRIGLVQDNFKRLDLNADLRSADANQLDNWWDGALFDRVLVDAPCSGTGVIRRHPDIKLLRRPADIDQFGRQQARLLRNLWKTLKPGGLLLYATCSIMPEENSNIAQQFLNAHPDAEEKKIDAAWGLEQPVGRQILPTTKGGDGFFFSRFQKH